MPGHRCSCWHFSGLALLLALAVALPWLPAAVHAQRPLRTDPIYLPGWNQVGGPPNSNFGNAEALFSWNAAGQTYVDATGGSRVISSAPPTCSGYWAYFPAARDVSLPVVGGPGATASCSLQAGWNLIGNPFSSAAPISASASVTAFHWNPTTSAYEIVSVVPVGASVWIYNDGSLPTVTLTST